MRLSSSKNSSGGSSTGFPRDRSKTFSAPYFWLRIIPSSNILRIHDPCSMKSWIFFATAIGYPPMSVTLGTLPTRQMSCQTL